MSDKEECEHNRPFWECEICGNVKASKVKDFRDDKIRFRDLYKRSDETEDRLKKLEAYKEAYHSIPDPNDMKVAFELHAENEDKDWLKGTPFSKWIERLEKLEIQANGLYSTYHKHFINIDERIDTLSAVMKEHLGWHDLGSQKAEETGKEHHERLIKQLDGTSTEGKKDLNQKIEDVKEKLRLNKEERTGIKELDGSNWNPTLGDGIPEDARFPATDGGEPSFTIVTDSITGVTPCIEKEEQEPIMGSKCKTCDAYDPESCASQCKDMHDNMPLRCEKEAEPFEIKPEDFREGYVSMRIHQHTFEVFGVKLKNDLIAEFIEKIKHELDYIETINYYNEGTQCIPVQTLQEQFDKLIKEYEAKLRETVGDKNE